MRVLSVDGNEQTLAGIAASLRAASVVCDTTPSGEDAIQMCKIYDYDIITLGLLLEDVDGYGVLRHLRGARVRTPILVLSGSIEIDFKLEAFALGADDYMTKPFDRRELLARIKAIVWRSGGHALHLITIGSMTVDIDDHVVRIDAKQIPLTKKEWEVFEVIVLRKGRLVTKELILDHVYGGKDEPDGNVISVFVCHMREKFRRASGGKQFIDTVWGLGYKLVDIDDEFQPTPPV